MSEKHRKEIESLLNKSESGVNKRLQKLYKELAEETTQDIIKLAKEIEETDKFSKKLQKERLETIRSQMYSKVNQLEGTQKKNIFDFLRHDSNVAFNELFYDFEMTKKVPLTFTMLTDKQINVIINTPVANRKLSTRLKGNSTKMKQNLNRVLTRGFAKGLSTQKMAVQIAEIGGANYRRAMNIARTESGRVTSVARQQSQNHAKSLGLKLEKQWISTLDKLTRHTHRILDGKTIDIDAYFEIDGHKALQPHMFGAAAEDCNCRCRTITIVDGIGPELRKDNETKEVIEYQNYEEWVAAKTKDVEKSQVDTPETTKDRVKFLQKEMEKLENDEWGSLTEEEAEALYDKYDVELSELSAKLKEIEYNESSNTEAYLYNQSKDDAIEFFKNHSNYEEWKNSLSEEDLDLITLYTGSGYQAINEILRNGEEEFLNHWKYKGTPIEYRQKMIQRAKDIQKTIDNFEAKQDFIVYRGINGAFEDLTELEGIQTFDKGLMSTTLDKEVTKSFAEGDNTVLFTIRIKQGTKVGAYLDELSDFSGEKEFLIKPNTKFKILNKREEHGRDGLIQYIEMEAIE